MKSTIPPIDRIEWKQLITGELVHPFSNFVLQIQIDQAKRELFWNTRSETESVKLLHALCDKYTLAVKKDMLAIFKEW